MAKKDKSEEEIEVIKEIFLNNYSPAEPKEQGISFMSTRQIFHSLFSVYPHKDFTPDIVASWLIEFGYKTINMGNTQIEWIIKENN